MQQAVMTAPGHIILQDVARPTIQPHEVLLQTRRIGICGSDIHVYHGLHPYTSYPVVQGHEVSGTIAAVGADVRHLAVGDPVTFMPQVTCGTCYACRHGQEHICDSLKVMGFQTGGAAQEFFPVPAANVLKLPAGISLEQGAMIEPIAVAVHALRRGGEIAGKQILVLGAGPIGNLVAQTAQALGARTVMITDISEYKLEMARCVGINHVLNTSEADLGAALNQHFGPDKADLILECVGVQPTIEQAVAHARKGSTIVIVGVFGQKPVVNIGLVQDRELSLVGTLMYQRPDYETAIALVAEGKMQLDALITHRFPFAHYLEAYHTIEAAGGNSMKVMMMLDEGDEGAEAVY
ncbi:MAG: alcohol dehydrogenase catalytic domain-containing protein [Ardenticatenaceae bacterium]|nr:alcohol dehydrogenase catalytic domain-containing protein [Ardenticatenaceae bacterium]